MSLQLPALAPDARAEITRLKELFLNADTDESGWLDAQELGHVFKRLYADQGSSRSYDKVMLEVAEVPTMCDTLLVLTWAAAGNGDIRFGPDRANRIPRVCYNGHGVPSVQVQSLG